MFSLLYGFWQYMFKKSEFFVLILGLDHAGKTTLLEHLKALYKGIEPLSPDQIMPTVGLNIGRVDVSNVKLILWDLGGQAGLRSIWDKYFTEAHGVIFVVDSADESRFHEAKTELDLLLKHPEMSEVPLLFCINKQDLPNALAQEEIEKIFNLNEIRETREFNIQTLTAITGEGTREGLTWMVETLKQQAKTPKQTER